MPLNEKIIEEINEYCKRDLPGDIEWHTEQFDFVNDDELKKRLGRAYYSARYIYKLMEALYSNEEERHPFVKFQIIQYASIYEALINYLLWVVFSEHEEVKKLQTHMAYKPVSALGRLCKMTYDDKELFTCVYKESKTHRNSIPFKDKVDCSVRIGFIEEKFSEDIKRIYKLRNLAHIETEAKTMVDVEIEDAKNGYWRIKPILEKINEFLSNN